MGLLQHITYNEFLPAVLGDDVITDYKGYDSNINPGIFNEFAAAAYRFGHSMISDTVARREHDGSISEGGDIHLRDAFFNIQVLQQSGIDTVLRGASLQQAQEVDTQYVDGLRNFLFATPPEGSKCPMRGILRFTNGVFPGLDLGSRNIQRGRDHGLNSYNDVRESIGLKRLSSFEEITNDKEIVSKLKAIYNNDINNVDLYVAGLAEDHVSGSSLGESFREIVKIQFEAIRDGDRFWYENKDNKLFTDEELKDIRETRLSDIIERNTNITGLRDNVFFMDIKGTDGDDIYQGTHLADQFTASLGNDLINGGAGFDNIDYTSLKGPITLRFDGVLKSSNVIDELGLSAWEGLQDLANKGNDIAKKIFSLHESFFGKSTSGFFDTTQQTESNILVNEGPDRPNDLEFDQLNSIESIEANNGSSLDGRGATAAVEIDLQANSFRTNFFGHAIETIIKGFTNALGSHNDDVINGDDQDNILFGLSGNDMISGGSGADKILSGHGDDHIQGDAGDDKVDGGEGADTAVYRGNESDYKINRIKNIVTVQDNRHKNSGQENNDLSDGTDQLENIESFRFNDGEVQIKDLNEGPALTGKKAILNDGFKNWRYIIKKTDLLKGYTDANEDTLDVTNLDSSGGRLKDIGNGLWELRTSREFEGKITLTYSVIDGHGGEVEAANEVTIKQAVLEGTNQTESLTGNGRDEWIYAYNGFDTVRSAGGDDRVYGGYGNDTLYGGNGNDQIYGEQDDDILRGGAGDDELYGGYGNDNIKGGDGDDRLTGGEGSDILDGGNGSDIYFLDDERDTIKDTGTQGTDTVYYRYLSNKYELGEGIENVVLPGSAHASKLMVMGNSADNDIISGDGDDTVMAGDGDDTIYTGSGDDKVEAGRGDDLIIGGEGAGDDSYNGGSGFDTIKYTSATDNIVVDLTRGVAGSKNGSNNAGIGSDILLAIEGVIGSYYDDLLIGDATDNIFDAEKGDDTIKGGAGKDIAIYKGNFAEYNISNSGSVLEIRDTKIHRDGFDRLFDIEGLQFNDGSTIDCDGSICLFKDLATKGFAKDLEGNQFSIKDKWGNQVSDSSYQGWEMLGAEIVDGRNQVMWGNINGSFYQWKLDTDWKYIGASSISGRDLLTAEINFGQDFNVDGIIGLPITTVESQGAFALLKGSGTKAFAQDRAGNQFSIKDKWGNQVSDTSYEGWEILGAEIVDGSNQVMWGHTNGSFYQWKLDNGWKYIGASSISGRDLLTAEINFGQDFNVDGIIGLPIATVESKGAFALLKGSGTKAFAQDLAGNQFSIKDKWGNQVSDTSYEGWKYWQK